MAAELKVLRSRPGRPAIHFHRFADLCAELQDRIWETVCFDSPATIGIIVTNHHVKMVGTLPSFPHLLHATSGARAIGLRFYEAVKSFKTFDREPHLSAVNLHPLNLGPMPPTQAVPGPILPPPAIGFGYSTFGMIPNLRPPAHIRVQVPMSVPDPERVILVGTTPVLEGNVISFKETPEHAGELLPVEDVQTILSARAGVHKIYVNFSADLFKLQIKDKVTQYYYPTISFTEDSTGKAPKKARLEGNDLEEAIATLRYDYRVPPQFSGIGNLPPIFDKIENLVLNLVLLPCADVTRFSEWAEKEVETLLSSVYVSSTLRRFSNLHRVDFHIGSDNKIDPLRTTVTLKHFRCFHVRNTDGVTFDEAQVKLVEEYLEYEMVKIREELGKDYLESPRLVTFVEDKAWEIVTADEFAQLLNF
ncbi:uncharacterized protein RCO7_06043 [Rhynchosporium graminicola]|uniref:2EXR domain-containing protein n=1 Tax=Rhynchosporium graminicola TaxID=2792576 RepID=A0A1E1KXM7_9HELO|nr:uncharacterized protein RCO7_06043 [Rhynchosporium commune]